MLHWLAQVCFWTGMIFMTLSLSFGRKKSMVWHFLTGREKREISSIDLIFHPYKAAKFWDRSPLMSHENAGMMQIQVDLHTNPSHPFGHCDGHAFVAFYVHHDPNWILHVHVHKCQSLCYNLKLDPYDGPAIHPQNSWGHWGIVLTCEG